MLDLMLAQCVSITITMPSLFLYILECWFIFRGRNNKYEGSFYRIFLLSAINNIFINFLLTLFTFRLQTMSALFALFLSIPSWAARMFFALYYYNLHVESLWTLLILIHRLSAIVTPLQYEKVWKKLLPYVSTMTFLFPLISVYHIFFIEVCWTPYTTDGEEFIGLDYNHTAYPNAPSNSKLAFIISAIFLILCLSMNVAILAAYKRVNAKHGNANEHNAKIEFRLMLYALLIFMIQAFVCIFWFKKHTYLHILGFFTEELLRKKAIIDFCHDDLPDPFYILILKVAIYMFEFDDALFTHIIGHYILLNDLRAFVFPAWFLLWASSDIRKHVQKFVFCTKKMSPNASLMVNNGTAQKQIVPIKSVNVVTIR